MNYLELSIIYLTCGTPFGVYYFTKQNQESNSAKIWLKSILVSLLWIPYSIKLFHSLVTKKLQNIKKAEEIRESENLKHKSDEFERRYSKAFVSSDKISLFDFKETFQRFVGLTQLNLSLTKSYTTPISNFSQLGLHDNPNLFTICLNRRNRKRLEQHQIIAREDFVNLLKKIDICGNENILAISQEFAVFINDAEFENELSKIIKNSKQISDKYSVKNMEKTLWNTTPKPLTTAKTPLNLRTMTAKVALAKKD